MALGVSVRAGQQFVGLTFECVLTSPLPEGSRLHGGVLVENAAP